MNANLESLREEHEKLVVKAEEELLPEDLLPQVDAFMQKVQKAGASVGDSLERNLLRSFLRYWGNYVYKHKRVYPNAELEPFTQLTPPPKSIKFSPVSLLVAGVLVLLTGVVVSLFAFGPLSVRQTPTPITTVQPPTISELKVGTSGPLRPGEETSIFVTVSKAAGVTLTYTWHVDDGEIIKGQGSPAITYRAPDKPGTYLIRVVVKWGDQSVEKAAFIEVGEPTPTSPPQPSTATPTTSSPGITPTLPVRILQPCNGDSVPYETQIRGDYRGSVGELNLWVIVCPHGSDRYYPQRPAEIRGDNTWLVMARFGQATLEESGKVFDISVYLASSQADQKLKEYISEADKTGSWPGMPSLADGLTLLDRVTVTRR